MNDSSNFSKPKPPHSIQQNPNFRTFPTVGGEDFEDHQPDFSAPLSSEQEQAIKKARQEKLNPTISQPAKIRLEYLADIGRITKEVKIGPSTFTLRTLKSKEQRQVFLTLVDVNNKVDEAYNLKLHSLAHSLLKIDGQDLEMVLPIRTFQDRISFLENLEESTIDQLFTAYQELKTSSDQQFALKTEQDVKEVSDALGKS